MKGIMHMVKEGLSKLSRKKSHFLLWTSYLFRRQLVRLNPKKPRKEGNVGEVCSCCVGICFAVADGYVSKAVCYTSGY